MAAVGEQTRIAGFALAGVSVLPAEDPEAVRAAWHALPPGTALVIVTRNAADALGGTLTGGTRPLVAVMPG